jgi:hypothetical protein
LWICPCCWKPEEEGSGLGISEHLETFGPVLSLANGAAGKTDRIARRERKSLAETIPYNPIPLSIQVTSVH